MFPLTLVWLVQGPLSFEAVLEFDKLKDNFVRKSIEVLVEEIMTRVVAKVPFLGWSLVNPVAHYLLRKLIFEIYEVGALLINSAIIDFRIDKEVKAVNEAREKVREASSSGDEKEVEDANEELKESVRNLYRIGRSVL